MDEERNQTERLGANARKPPMSTVLSEGSILKAKYFGAGGGGEIKGGCGRALPLGVTLRAPEYTHPSIAPIGGITEKEKPDPRNEEWTITVPQFWAVVTASMVGGAVLLAFIQEALR